MEQKSFKAWLYLLPAILFLGVFMVYPLIDVVIYSFEEGSNSASQTYFGIGTYMPVLWRWNEAERSRHHSYNMQVHFSR